MTDLPHTFATDLSGSLADRLRDESQPEPEPGDAGELDEQASAPRPPAATSDDPPFGSLRFARLPNAGRDA